MVEKGNSSNSHTKTLVDRWTATDIQVKKEAPLDGPALRRAILSGMTKATAPATPIIEHGELYSPFMCPGSYRRWRRASRLSARRPNGHC